jgi:transcriptional regulator with XRE-family HTH domain
MAARIRRARIGARLTQSELACLVNVRRSAVAQWERSDGTTPTTDHIAVVAAKTGVHLEWLATGRGPARLDDPSDPQVEIFGIARNSLESRMLDAMKRLQPAKRELALRMVELLVSD